MSNILYGKYKLDKKSAEDLKSFLFNNCSNFLVGDHELHCTVVYSDIIPDKAEYAHITIPDSSIVNAIGFDFFGKDKDIIVLKCQSSELAGLHNEFLDVGCVYKYDYQPHISIKYNATSDDINKIISGVKDFNLKLKLIDWSLQISNDNTITMADGNKINLDVEGDYRMKWVRKEAEHDPDWLEYHCEYENHFVKVFRNSYGDWRIILYTDIDSPISKRIAMAKTFDSLEKATEFAEELLVVKTQGKPLDLPNSSSITTKVKQMYEWKPPVFKEDTAEGD